MAVNAGLVVASTILVFCAIEVSLRIVYPFAQPSWPAMMYRFGPAFRPGATVRWTNLRDFCVEQRANSLGFLDREPPEGAARDEVRILILGDSFVQAAEVPLPDKLQVRLEDGLRRAFPGRKFRVNALGYSGSGTADELAFYERFGSRFRPDLVIVVFVSNDFANNSILLETVRNGWHPEHLPRPFFYMTDRGFRRAAVDPQWCDHRIDPPSAPSEPPLLAWVPGIFRGSTTFAWVRARLADDAARMKPLMASRISWLRRNPAWRDELDGWRYPDDEEMDAMFFAEEMPPAFQRAEEITGHALDAFRALSARDGFRLLVAAADNCSGPSPRLAARKLLPRGPLVRLRRLAEPRGIEVVDLMDYFRRNGFPDGSHFAHDGHWNRTGHRLASEALIEFLSSRADGYLAAAGGRGRAGTPPE